MMFSHNAQLLILSMCVVQIHIELPWGLITTVNTIPTADKIIKPVDTVEGANRALGTPNFKIDTISLESDRF
jgi:hypothetical protein